MSFVKNRRSARILAVQCLYNIAQVPEHIKTFDEITNDVLLYGVANSSDLDQEYFLNLINGCDLHVKTLHAAIQTYLLKNWKVSRLPQVMQSILTLGCYELIHNSDIPHSVVISEYVTLAKIFNHAGESGFVNNILDKIAKNCSQIPTSNLESALPITVDS